MSTERRVRLIGELERQFESRIITMVLGDRPVCTTQIADDCIRPIYDHLLAIGHVPKLQLLLYSIGGLTETPWKIVNTLRPFCENFEVIVPYKAYSAATMICMGANRTHMTRKAELGPVDPSLMINPGEGAPTALVLRDLGVEDVASYISFLRNRAGLTDQAAVSQLISVLATTLTPPLLGRIERVYSHIRLVSRKLLDLCKPAMEDRVITSVIQALTEKTYVHNHGIGREEAKQIGMQVGFIDGETEDKVWELFCDYEDALHLSETHDVESLIPEGSDVYQEPNAVSAYIESSGLSCGFSGAIQVRRIRRIPAQPTININLQLQVPPGVNPAQLPQNAQAALQQLLTQGSQQIQQMVVQEITRQSPVERIEAKMVGGKWLRL
jgi:hypothetical protein